MTSDWNSELYDQRFSFVWQHGADLLPLLDARPGERILDLGCGTGRLAAQIAAVGADVVGLDRSADMIEQARRNFPLLHFQQADATDFSVADLTGGAAFDAVFSNAVLHWVCDAEAVVRRVAAALKPGGRFVAEFGGQGNISHILEAVTAVTARHGFEARNLWYFPDVAEYSALLEAHGFEIRAASLFDRLTLLDDPELGMVQWLNMFGADLLASIPPARRATLVKEMSEHLRPTLFRDGRWYADYRRLRVVAIRRK